MADQLSFEELEEFLVSLSNTINRTAAVYYSSDFVGLEMCERRLEEHTRVRTCRYIAQCHKVIPHWGDSRFLIYS